MVRHESFEIQLPAFVRFGRANRIFLDHLPVGLNPDPGMLLAIAVKPELRTGDPAINGVVHVVIDLTDALAVGFTQHPETFVIQQLGAGILRHEVHPEDAKPVLHFRGQCQ